ncbi:MAG: hypothetical protein HC878_00345, partial [Leptolyngbyaceae cyanobacterium SL_5_14]|nr:hypothetical protein [Leptolyngbyaceae cyanobacterium SL_5_14]
MANLIDVLIKTTDQLSPSIDRIKGNLAGAVLTGNLMSSALTGAFNLATQGVQAFGSALADAMDTQNSVIMTAGYMSEIMGVPFEQGTQFVTEMTSRMALLAADLPGTTADFTAFARNILDDVALINKETNGGILDLSSFNGQIDLITSKFQLLANQPGLTKAQGIGAFQSILGGRSIVQLEKLEFFRTNPSFLNALKSVEQGMGKSFEEMTRPERLAGLIESLNNAISDTTIDKLRGTLSAQLEGFKTKLIDPNVGLFGLLRDVDDKIAGQQNIIEALTNTAFIVLSGKNSLFGTLNSLFAELGFATDPMKVLYDAILFVNQEILGLTKIVAQIKNFVSN